MASKSQYECFREVFAREEARYETLIERAKLYLSVLTLYFGLLAVAADRINPVIRQQSVAVVAYLTSFAAFVAAMVLVVGAMGILRYVYPTDPRAVAIASLGSWPDDSEFFDDRIKELAAAFHTNHAVNDRRARLLKFASVLLVAGIAAQAVVLSILVFIQP